MPLNKNKKTVYQIHKKMCNKQESTEFYGKIQSSVEYSRSRKIDKRQQICYRTNNYHFPSFLWSVYYWGVSASLLSAQSTMFSKCFMAIFHFSTEILHKTVRDFSTFFRTHCSRQNDNDDKWNVLKWAEGWAEISQDEMRLDQIRCDDKIGSEIVSR